MTLIKAIDVVKDVGVITHAQRIMRNGALIVPPSGWYYQP
jgi:hypothetical protein